MRRRLLIAEPDDFSPRALALLQGQFDVECDARDASGLRDALRDYDVVWVKFAHQIDEASFPDSVRCRTIAIPATGTDHISAEACARRGISVISLRDQTAWMTDVRATAEHTVGLLLALVRRLPAAAHHVETGGWDRNQFRGNEIFGKTAGIVGMGRLGTRVATYLRAFDMRVVGYDPFVTSFASAAERVDSLHALASQVDVLTLHVPYAPATHHLIDSAVLASLKPGAWIINTSRGGIIDELALVAALDSGGVAGVAVDVLQGEPKPHTQSALLNAQKRLGDRLLVTPHIAGNTHESLDKAETHLAKLLIARDEAQ